MRLERLLLLHRRRSASEENAFKERLRVGGAPQRDPRVDRARRERLDSTSSRFSASATELLGTRFARELGRNLVPERRRGVLHGLHGLAARRRRSVARRLRAAAARERSVSRARDVHGPVRRLGPRTARRDRPARRGARSRPSARGASSGIPIHREGEADRRPRHVVGRAPRVPAGRARVLRARRRPARARDPRRAPLRKPPEPGRGARARAAPARARRPRPLAAHRDARPRHEEPSLGDLGRARAHARQGEADGRRTPREAPRRLARVGARTAGPHRGRAPRLPVRGRPRDRAPARVRRRGARAAARGGALDGGARGESGRSPTCRAAFRPCGSTRRCSAAPPRTCSATP